MPTVDETIIQPGDVVKFRFQNKQLDFEATILLGASKATDVWIVTRILDGVLVVVSNPSYVELVTKFDSVVSIP